MGSQVASRQDPQRRRQPDREERAPEGHLERLQRRPDERWHVGEVEHPAEEVGHVGRPLREPHPAETAQRPFVVLGWEPPDEGREDGPVGQARGQHVSPGRRAARPG
jgi:hypothetical protein